MFTVLATWLNDGTAELDIRCEECERWLNRPSEDDLARISLLALNALADAHECPEAC
jgi:hypothetical protein